MEAIPLNKFLSSAGVCSRRKAVELIEQGLVRVNKTVVKEPFFRVSEQDVVFHKGRHIKLDHEHIYILFNKPKGCVTTTADEEGRTTVLDLVGNATDRRIFPVGRLDFNTTGLLLLTSDGDFAQKLAHPKHSIQKKYSISLSKPLSDMDFAQLQKGVRLSDGFIRIDELIYKSPHKKDELFVTLHSGRNRIIRRIFEHFNYEVRNLDRVAYASFTQKGLARGEWRELKSHEVKKILARSEQ